MGSGCSVKVGALEFTATSTRSSGKSCISLTIYFHETVEAGGFKVDVLG